MTPSGVYKTRNVRRRPELERWDFEFLTTLKGSPWNPNPAAGEMAADALSAAPVDQAGSRLYIMRSNVQKDGYSMNCPGCTSVMAGTTARAYTGECRRRLENCLAEDEETKFGESSRISQERSRSGDAVSHAPSGAASRSSPAAAASSSAPAVASSSSAS